MIFENRHISVKNLGMITEEERFLVYLQCKETMENEKSTESEREECLVIMEMIQTWGKVAPRGSQEENKITDCHVCIGDFKIPFLNEVNYDREGS